jgi:phage gpG-like protein
MKEIQRLMKKLKREVTNMKIPMKKVSIQFEKWIHDNFDTEGSGLGSDSWPDFKIGGRRLKGGRIDTSARLLQDTRQMRASFRPFHSAKNAGIGSALDRSKFHHEGLPARGLPSRRLIPLREEILPDAVRAFEQHLEHVARRHGRVRG